ncbi:MAG TPA: response regulator transcription factor [Labilithrix sp.]|nr:response regulator transcription factor [Labilithrix sp.]
MSSLASVEPRDPPLRAAAPPRSRIVLVAADAQLRSRIRILLEAGDYLVDVLETVDDAVAALAASVPDLVVYAPTHDADGEIRMVQSATTAGIVVLAATPGEAGVIRALDAGADDAVPPPYARGELLARLRSTLRRAKRAARAERRFADLTLDVEARELHVDGRPIALTRLELRLLEELMVASGLAVKHDDLLTRIWGPTHRGRLNYLRVYVARLRRKIEVDPARPRIIHSVPGVGYRLASPEPRSGEAPVSAPVPRESHTRATSMP